MFRAARRIAITVSSIVVVLGLLLFVVAPRVIDARANRILVDPPYQASERARQMMARLFVVDLHADSLLWVRKLGRQHSRGHVDVPRLIEANEALQGFTIVTKVPWGLNIERNSASAR